MDTREFNKVKKLSYDRYCDYLRTKYGRPARPYFTEGFGSKTKISRTKEGLFIHHVKEDTVIKLSDLRLAKTNPYEYQLPKNLVYCDYLEHVLLHIKICEKNKTNRNMTQVLGMQGIVCYFIPILNDIYCGYESSLAWQKSCADKIKENKDVYIRLLKYIWKNLRYYPLVSDTMFYSTNRFNLTAEEKSKYLDLFTEIATTLDLP